MTVSDTRASFLRSLAALDTSAVCDALDRLGLRGACTALSAVAAPRRIVGTAVTVRLTSDDGTGTTRHLCAGAVAASGPGDIIVVANDGRKDAAGWGGILSFGARMRGIEGVIVDGACRDVDEIRDLGLTVYARGAVPLTARKRVKEAAWNVPVVIEGIIVSPADVVWADASGIVFVPSARLQEVVDQARRIAAREGSMIEALRAGKSIDEVMGADYEALTTRDTP